MSVIYKYLMTSKLNIQEFTLEADDSGILQEFLILYEKQNEMV